MKNNPNKVVMAGPNNFCISYADSKKHHWMNYESSVITKDIQSKIPNRLYQEKLRLSPKQVKMYRLAVYGVEALTPEEFKVMSASESDSIRKTQSRAQRLINLWKQEIVNNTVNEFLVTLFPQSKLINKLVTEGNYTSQKDINPFSFKELGISQKMLIDKLVEWNILPVNFYQLN
jgi:hypothetical protein